MAIPGYDPGDIEEYSLEGAGPGARLSVVAAAAPESVALERSDAAPPPDALAAPVELVGADALERVEAVRITLEYDPGALPAGASPTDVAVAVASESLETSDHDAALETLDSEVDLEATEVAATLTDRPSGSTVVPIHDGG